MEFRPGGYLDQHLEEAKTENIEVNNPDRPIIEGLAIDYNSQNELMYVSGDSSLNIEFGRLPYETAIDRMNALQQASTNANEAEKKAIEGLLRFYNSPTFIINNFILQKGDKTLDLNELKASFPNIQITFNPKKEIGIFYSGQFNKGSKKGPMDEILVSGDITKIDTVLAMLHEIGHHVNPTEENLAARSRFTKRGRITEKEAEQILESERTAWAFALRTIKPFLDSRSRADAIRYLHEYSLQSYSDGIREQVAPAWKLILAHIEEAFSDVF